MSRAERIAAAVALVVTGAIIGAGIGHNDTTCQPLDGQNRPTVTAHPHRIEEDEPGWNCATMGNRICGPEAPR